MPNKIHHTAIVSEGSKLKGEEIEIGPYSIIGPNVIIVRILKYVLTV